MSVKGFAGVPDNHDIDPACKICRGYNHWYRTRLIEMGTPPGPEIPNESPCFYCEKGMGRHTYGHPHPLAPGFGDEVDCPGFLPFNQVQLIL